MQIDRLAEFVLARQCNSPTVCNMEAGLYIVGTPIGNLGDISHRALETLSGADLIVAEDTRHSRRLTDRYEIDTRLMSCHKFNEMQRSEQIITRIHIICIYTLR